MGDSDLEPFVRKRSLPKPVRVARREADRAYAEEAEVHAERRRRALAVARGALDRLIGLHERVGNRYGFDIGSDTRWSAMWELAAALLSYVDAAVHLLESGYHAQILPLYRTIHEATWLLYAFRYPEEEELLRRFIDKKSIQSGDAHRALKREVERIRERNKASGIEEDVPQINVLAGRLYGHLSEASHLGRDGLSDFFDARTRRAFYREHDDPALRSSYAEQGLLIVENITMVVGAALHDIAGGDFYGREIEPINERIGEVTSDPAFVDDVDDLPSAGEAL